MRMKIFSCQHVPPPQGTREPFVCALLAVPTHNNAEKKNPPPHPRPPVKVDMFSDRARKTEAVATSLGTR